MGLLDSLDLARALFQEAGDALFLTDPVTDRILDANPVALRLTGFDRGELLRMTTAELIQTAPDGNSSALRRATQHTTIFHGRGGFHLRTRSDEWVPVNLTVARLHLAEMQLGLITARDTRDQIAARTRQQQLEAELRRVVATVPVGLWSARPKESGGWECRFASPRMAELLSVPAGQARSVLPFGSYVHPSDRERVQREFEEFLASSQSGIEIECRVTTQSGKERWLRDRLRVQRAENGRPMRLDGMLTDVTDAKRVEQGLRENEAVLRSILRSLPDGVLLLAPDGHVRFANPAAEQILAMSTEALVGRPWAELGIDRSTAEPNILSTPTTPLQAEECEYVRPDGRRVILTLSLAAVRGGGGMVVAFADVTARRRAEHDLRSAQRLADAIIEGAPVGIQMFTANGEAFRHNQAADLMLGLDNTATKAPYNLLEDPLAAECGAADLFRRALAGEPAENRDLLYDIGDSRNVWPTDRREIRLHAIFFPVQSEGNEVQVVVGFYLDRTQHHALEEQLRQSEKLEAIGQLAGGVAHDFNNLLTAILANTSLARQQLPTDDPMQTLLRENEQAAERAADLTRQLLTFSRRNPLKLVPLELSTVVTDTAAMLRRTIDPRIQLDLQIESVPVRGDTSQLTHLLMNLALNARDAMPEGGRLSIHCKRVSITPADLNRSPDARTGEFAHLCVADTGMGISAEVMSRIYDPFFTTKPVGQGTGLGLARARGIVQQHGGWMICDSEPSRGTRFHVYLPVATMIFQTPSPANHRPNGGSEMILLVDDEPSVQAVGKAILGHFGYTVETADDGQEAVERFDPDRHALIIIDQTMPRKTGRDAAAELVARHPSVKIILASGYTAEAFDPATLSGVAAFLHKPYRPAELAELVRTVLDSPAPTPRKPA